MLFFVAFIFSAVILGIGVMLAPALPTDEPRIGLASTIALASIILTGVVWTVFVSWDTLIIDYVLFGLVSLVILGGTMIQAQDEDASTQWMTRHDFIFLLVLGGLCLVSLGFQAPITSIQIEGISAFQEGQTLAQIISQFPNLNTSGLLGIHILSAYLSQQLQQDISVVYSAVQAVLLFLCIFTTYDFGTELKDTQLGQILASVMFVILIVATVFFQVNLLAILLSLGILTFALRVYRHRQILDGVGLLFLVITLIVIYPIWVG